MASITSPPPQRIADLEPAGPDLEAGARSVAPTPLLIAAIASGAAGLVHAAAAGTHNSDRTLSLLFAGCAAAQLLWAVVAVLRPQKLVVGFGAALNLAAVAAWGLSRTRGLPVVAALAEKEDIGTQDLVSAILGAAAVVFAVAAVVGARRPVVPDSGAAPSRRGAHPLAGIVAGTAALALAVPGMTAAHTHGADDHGHGTETATGAAGHDHATGAPADHDHTVGTGDAHDHTAAGTEHDHVATTPIISVSDERVTPEPRARALALIDETLSAMDAFPDIASLEAAGYVSIGDALTGFEHYIKWAYLADGKELDPSAIESIVAKVDRGANTRTPVSAMYILDKGKTMDDVPDVAGELTTWHDHTNLCWDDTGTRLAGILRDGTCFPGGTLWVTPPMLHVWKEVPECGPFAGLEGHGTGGGLGGGLLGLGLRNRSASPTTTAPFDPAVDCAHGHGEATAGGDDHAHDGTGTGDESASGGGHQHAPLPARLDHEPTDEQRAAARELIADTKTETAKYATTDAAATAGYYPIGDAMTGVEHWVHTEYMANDTILDPTQPESLVYKVLPDGGRLLQTAMYILPDGATMDDVPDVAGRLAVFHDHQNLCWNPETKRLAGIKIGDTCVPGGEFKPTAPMLHVWVIENECGPFAGTDAGNMTGSCVHEDI